MSNSFVDSFVRELPLSHGQERIWLHHQVTPAGALHARAAYNMVVAEQLSGPLDIPALRRALDEIVARHEILRTVFTTSAGRPVQRVRARGTAALEVLDLGQEPGTRVREVVEERANRVFDLTSGPLFRATLLRLAEREHVLCLVMHHIVGDAWSLSRVLLGELAALYAAFAAGLPSPLPPLTRQYGDYVRLRRAERIPGEQLAYWAKTLAGVPSLDMSADPPSRAVPRSTSGLVIHCSPGELHECVALLARRIRCTPFMLYMAAYAVLLSRYTGQQDFCVGTSVAGRAEEEFEPLIGMFVNTLALRADLSGDPPFLEFLRRVRRVALGGFAHAEVPYELVDAVLQEERGGKPLISTMFLFNGPPAPGLSFGGLETSPVISGLAPATFDLTLEVMRLQGHLRIMFTYDAEVVSRVAVKRMASHLERLLWSVIADPEARVSRLTMLPQWDFW
ncbi:condensation domain-containing protein [Sinosporangium siamense]|uniref:Condensation domain-containing protein n=1 Tax=Sinosporangium siamense TaxID=1367973 RepID=A0A919RDJ8_9ACTN|nr:condensation domain-containing protein [Sinosporangium siamense]GII89876.1 hypothetical protein Ssi02_01070 [Sinosporangium siamense]